MIMKFCERLKDYREKKGLTQSELSKLSGISVRMIQKYEAGIVLDGNEIKSLRLTKKAERKLHVKSKTLLTSLLAYLLAASFRKQNVKHIWLL